PELSGQRIFGQFTLRTAVPGIRCGLAAGSGTEVRSADVENCTRIRCTSQRRGALVHESDTGCGKRTRSSARRRTTRPSHYRSINRLMILGFCVGRLMSLELTDRLRDGVPGG